MFIKNDYVMYGLTGVCKVADIRKESAGNQRGEEYFILHPVKDEHSKIMIPVSRGKARMRPLVNKTEVMKFMEDMRESDDIWETDMKERGKMFQERLKSGSFYQWLLLSSIIWQEKEKKKTLGKKVSMSDEQVFKNAWNLLCEELAVSLGMEEDEVISMLAEHSSMVRKVEF